MSKYIFILAVTFITVALLHPFRTRATQAQAPAIVQVDESLALVEEIAASLQAEAPAPELPVDDIQNAAAREPAAEENGTNAVSPQDAERIARDEAEKDEIRLHKYERLTETASVDLYQIEQQAIKDVESGLITQQEFQRHLETEIESALEISRRMRYREVLSKEGNRDPSTEIDDSV